MSSQHLTIVPAEPEERDRWPEDFVFFDIICGYLQSDSKEAMDAMVTEILTLLPEGRPYSSEVGHFVETCYGIAEQIPFDHVAMLKLVKTIKLCLDSSKFPIVKGSNDIQTDPRLRYKKMSETMRDWFNTTEPYERPEEHVNWHAFVAHTEAQGMVRGVDFAVWELRMAFEMGKTGIEKDANVQASCHYLLLRSRAIYEEVVIEEGQKARWQRWYDGLSLVAGDKQNEELAGLAKRALEAMEAVEWVKAE